MDRNAILSGLMSSFSTYSSTDSRPTAEKVLKYSGDSADLVQRADIKREAVVFRYQAATTNFLIQDSKPTDLEQAWDVLVFVEQGDSHSIKEVRYDRMLELTDQIIDWSVQTLPEDVDPYLCTITLTGASGTVEFEGYLSTSLTFNSTIIIQ